jgi:DNA-binding transcriptional MerR regulator
VTYGNGIHAALENAGVVGMTTKQVADILGVSTVTISRWRKAQLVMPKPYKHGKLTVYVFSDQDVKVLEDIKQRMKPGRRRNDDNTVRITKPPRPQAVSPQAQRRHQRNQELRKERALASKTFPGSDLHASPKEDGP